MSKKPLVDSNRRRVVLGGMAMLAGVPLVKTLLIHQAWAADLPHLSEDDPAARALNYHEDASKAPRSPKGGTAAKEQFCHNCQFIKASSGKWRPCQIFPDKAVNENGWCMSWAPK